MRDSHLQEGAAPKRYLTPKDVADELGVSERTVMRAIAARDLEASQLGQRGTWRIKRSSIEKWLLRRSNRRRRSSAPPPALAAARQRTREQLRVEPGMGRR